MTKIPLTPESRVTHASPSGAIRTWFNPSPEVMAKAPFAPRDVARQVLTDSADLFKWKPDLPDLVDHAVLHGVDAHSVRLRQKFKGVPVDASEVVVNMYADGRVHSIYNHYHYDIPKDLDPTKIKVDAKQARDLVERLLRVYENREIREPELIVYQYQRSENQPPKPARQPSSQRANFLAAAADHLADAWGDNRPKDGNYFLAWDFVVSTRKPSHSWRILVDAMTGRLVNVIDLLQYASGTGQVFDPNPIVTSGVATLSSGTAIGTLDAQRIGVTLDRLDPAIGGDLRLDGAFVKMQEIEAPVFAEPVSATGNFNFSSNNRNFLATMCYYHIDRFQNYIQTDLVMTNVCNFSIPVDPQGFNGADNSRYDPTSKNLAFGEGGIPDDADAHVILHEYGHAIQDNVNPGFGGGSYSGGTSEGFGDFLAAVYYDDKHANPAATRGATFPWDANTTDAFWAGRRYDVNWLFDGPEFSGASGHGRAQLWCAAMFELYRKLGGDSVVRPGVKRAARDLIIRLHLMANFNVASSGTTAAQMGQQVEVADGNLGGWRYANGLHKKVIYDTFRRRHLSGYPDKAVDVYVNDGREGGYGSPSGNDLFNENLWDENYWDTQDIWVKTAPYASAADQAAGGAGDHVEPPVDSIANLYVRVKNRGANAAGSGLVTVRAFHCMPGMGLVWPDAWTPMDTPSIDVANILPGPGNGVVVGPFPWTPAVVGHECVLVIVECANDRAVTQDLLATDHVPHSDLVPFDNNIAQRNLAPTAAKSKMIRGFYVNNPYTEARTVRLHFDSTLPQGWRWRTNLATNDGIRLGPLERRWVELLIDQAGGAEVTHFDKPHTLTVTGTIDDRVIGGMTFYVAPPSAFGKPSGKPVRELCAAEPCCLNIPWAECDFEGEIEVKIRFRKR